MFFPQGVEVMIKKLTATAACIALLASGTVATAANAAGATSAAATSAAAVQDDDDLVGEDSSRWLAIGFILAVAGGIIYFLWIHDEEPVSPA
jgi:hypothetical protein